MAPNEQARKNHEALFPGHVSTLTVTDPELIDVFDNFAFDEVLHHGNLDPRSRLMSLTTASTASRQIRQRASRPRTNWRFTSGRTSGASTKCQRNAGVIAEPTSRMVGQ